MRVWRPGVGACRMIAATMTVVAAAAVAVTVAHVRAGIRVHTPPAAPGLAALSDQQLAGLLPAGNAFPAG